MGKWWQVGHRFMGRGNTETTEAHIMKVINDALSKGDVVVITWEHLSGARATVTRIRRSGVSIRMLVLLGFGECVAV
jgi:hypothetical protein